MASERPNPTVLVIDDEVDLRSLLQSTLERADYNVVLAAGGQEGLRAFFEARPVLAIVDIIMPDMSGWTVLERIREVSETPVIMLTALGQEADRIKGLKGGADDYVAKPFSPNELVARCEAVLRRTQWAKAQADQEVDAYRDSVLQVNFRRREVYVTGEKVDLSPLEYRLLTALVQNPRIVVDPDELEDRAWGVGYGSRESLRVYIGNLRKKLNVSPEVPALIETVRGFGYRYEPPLS